MDQVEKNIPKKKKNRNTSEHTHRELAVSDGAVVEEVPGDLLHGGVLLRILVGVPGLDEVVAQQDLLDVAVGRDVGVEHQQAGCGNGDGALHLDGGRECI